MRQLMTWVCALICATFLLSSCCCKKFATSTTLERDTVNDSDSVNTLVRIETVHVPDTVYFDIPLQKSERTMEDSVSHLENDYAQSDARINPDGSLFHSLETKPHRQPVEFQKPIERKDSIVYRYKYNDRVKYKDREVVKEKELSKWQQTKIDYGGKAIVILLLIFAYRVYRIVRKFTIR